ncbi:spermidine synthase [Methylophaga lonarensis MPL]|uniref:Spermidine synthase n=1 Tax=Methylophaga lonarensis MPL TaxID=1286106 RepID=M7P0E7_9GAMM|nr:spermidine synthase [Methylophaga lonarensis]EMR12952.1 spermidine synthase [Methylophaga lonarensis MPL]
MRIYDGVLVHQAISDEGIIEVVDVGDVRSLHFGTHPRQSSMSLKVPYRLELSYTRAMMACLLFCAAPRKVLLIGLGGGSLVKFLLHHLPDCQIEVVEYREDVIQVAQRYFAVPDDPRLSIKKADGFAHASQQHYLGETNYDLILVDAFDHEGMAASVGVQPFFDACAGILSKYGIMATNLWGTDRAGFNLTMQRINRSFDDNSLVLPVEDKGNVIAFARHQAFDLTTLRKQRQQIEMMEMQYQTDLMKSWQILLRQNTTFISRWFG